MALVVKKFGGSSVATPEKMMNVAQRILAEKALDDKIVVVVSAMGDTTDNLIKLSNAMTDSPSLREMDMLLTTGEQVSIALLAMAFQKLSVSSISLTGPQAGINTSSAYSKAKILSINTNRIQQELDKGNIVVVAGFQGINTASDVTTLGRGGSDTTAVALAGALKADVCEIFTDVDGVYSADPRVVKTARKMQEVTYYEMLEMARLGAGVMQPRSVEMGQQYGVPIHVRSTFTQDKGTIIREEYTMEEKEFIIRGVTHDTNVAKVVVLGVPDQPGIAYKIFSALADNNIDVDMIVQSVRNNATDIIDILFTVSLSELNQCRSIVEATAKEMGALNVVIDETLAKVSVVGAGMLGSPGIAATMFGALSKANINIGVISTSEISISCLVDQAEVKNAVNAIHHAFFKEEE
ncbi:aspartate kinase [Sporomusaceae bacterium BoRhaA]|uniref:aspartate kinase n=1 Tax=Pelorhabdus rhamnosifermentans TaxID=2772457 RepID=UPI001C05F42C|nr:aspartate kinase [Pelorhabdus rhamnosifermentans]MBU2703455.1 aspartate kinase [Pelorhabdus rhamnosifermentans]